MDRTFTDNAGDAWLVFIDTYAVRDVRKQLGYDLLETFTEGRLLQLAGDPALVVDIVYVVCREQAEKRGLADREFGRRLIGDAVDGATTALLRALADFFPTPKRKVLEKILQKADQWTETETQSLRDVLETGELDRRLDAAMDPKADHTASQTPNPATPGS